MLTFFLTDPRATLVHIQAMGFTQPWVVVMSPGCQDCYDLSSRIVYTWGVRDTLKVNKEMGRSRLLTI
jgi:hypothetical protein